MKALLGQKPAPTQGSMVCASRGLPPDEQCTLGIHVPDECSLSGRFAPSPDLSHGLSDIRTEALSGDLVNFIEIFRVPLREAPAKPPQGDTCDSQRNHCRRDEQQKQIDSVPGEGIPVAEVRGKGDCAGIIRVVHDYHGVAVSHLMCLKLQWRFNGTPAGRGKAHPAGDRQLATIFVVEGLLASRDIRVGLNPWLFKVDITLLWFGMMNIAIATKPHSPITIMVMDVIVRYLSKLRGRAGFVLIGSLT